MLTRLQGNPKDPRICHPSRQSLKSFRLTNSSRLESPFSRRPLRSTYGALAVRGYSVNFITDHVKSFTVIAADSSSETREVLAQSSRSENVEILLKFTERPLRHFKTRWAQIVNQSH